MEGGGRLSHVLLLAAERLECMCLDHLELAYGLRLMGATDLGNDLSIRLIDLFYACDDSRLGSVIARGQVRLIDHIFEVL